MSPAETSQLDVERRWASIVCRWSPLLGIFVWALAAKYLLFVMYLKPPPTALDWTEALRWKPAIVLGLCGFGGPWLWLLAIDWQQRVVRCRRSRFPLAGILSLVWVGLVCLAFSSPRVVWFFVEWAKVRTPNPSFARNTLFWEARNFERKPEAEDHHHHSVGLVGSSQIYQGTDLDLLARQVPAARFEKNCLAGFGPLQYLWLKDRLLERRFNTIVCWLSEFDFFREDQLPVSRLRWAATPNGCRELWHAIDRPFVNVRRRIANIQNGSNWTDDADDQWEFRGDYADLSFAAVVPIWRHRDHIRRALFAYWWNVSLPTPVAVDEGPQLAQSSDLPAAQVSLRQNVGRKRLVDANFSAFQRFALVLKEHQIDLIVCEGTTDPRATAVYDGTFRRETRNRLTRMAVASGFTYLDFERLPQFTESDFADPYHLNADGRTRFSEYLADILQQHVTQQASQDRSHQRGSGRAVE